MMRMPIISCVDYNRASYIGHSPSQIVLLFSRCGIISVEVHRIRRITPSGIVVHVLNTSWGRIPEGSVPLIAPISQLRYGRHDILCSLPVQKSYSLAMHAHAPV